MLKAPVNSRHIFVAFLFALAPLTAGGCPNFVRPVEHFDDNDRRWLDAGWKRTLGTDHSAGNNEYLLLEGLPMEWSRNVHGLGYLYAAQPQADTPPRTETIAWSFRDAGGKRLEGRAITVRDGMELIAIHQSGAEYEVKVIRQTDFYVKVFYRKLGNGDDVPIEGTQSNDRK